MLTRGDGKRGETDGSRKAVQSKFKFTNPEGT